MAFGTVCTGGAVTTELDTLCLTATVPMVKSLYFRRILSALSLKASTSDRPPCPKTRLLITHSDLLRRSGRQKHPATSGRVPPLHSTERERLPQFGMYSIIPAWKTTLATLTLSDLTVVKDCNAMNTGTPEDTGELPAFKAFTSIGPMHEASVAYRDAVRAADRAHAAIRDVLDNADLQDAGEGSVGWLVKNDISVRESLIRLADALNDLQSVASRKGAAAVAETSSVMALSRWVARAAIEADQNNDAASIAETA
ncbi:MAG: hypothetical protein RL345_2217 [Chloroflexota bacterium]